MNVSNWHTCCFGDSLSFARLNGWLTVWRNVGCCGGKPAAFGVFTCSAWCSAIGYSPSQLLQIQHVWHQYGQTRSKWRWRGFNRQSVGGTQARKLSKRILFCAHRHTHTHARKSLIGSWIIEFLKAQKDKNSVRAGLLAELGLLALTEVVRLVLVLILVLLFVFPQKKVTLKNFHHLIHIWRWNKDFVYTLTLSLLSHVSSLLYQKEAEKLFFLPILHWFLSF